MLKRLLLVSILSILIVGALPAQAQEVDNNWVAWVYRHQTGHVTQIDPNGTIVRDFILPIGPAFLLYSENIIVSPSGRFIAYIVRDATPETPNRQLSIYNVSTDTLVGNFNLPTTALGTSLDFSDSFSFDEARSVFALGYALEDTWEIIQVDYNLNETLLTLTGDLDRVSSVVEDSEAVTMPVVQQAVSNGVIFTPLYDSQPINTGSQTYLWDSSDQGVVSIWETYDTITRDILRFTGEIIEPSADDRFEYSLPSEVYPSFNTAQVYAPQLDDPRFPIYHTDQRTIIDVNFVQNGERILVTEIDPSGIVAPEWVLLDREGTLVAETTAVAQPAQIGLTADGFTVLTFNGGLRLTHVRTVNNTFEQRPIWSDLTVDFGAGQLAFVQSFAPPPASLVDWIGITIP